MRGHGDDRGEPGDDGAELVAVALLAVVEVALALLVEAEICRRNPTTSLTSHTVLFAALGRAYLKIWGCKEARGVLLYGVTGGNIECGKWGVVFD